MKRITIEPVSRIEGHAKVTIQLDDAGNVADTRFQVTQVRGFEKFTEGRPFYEMPGITSRICGICPISHQLAASKACDAIMAVRIPKAARYLREIIHCGQFVQSHALSFFYLSGPDLLLGMDADPATRNVAGLIEANPEVARAGIELRKFGLQVIESLAEERVHASWIVPGGVKTPHVGARRATGCWQEFPRRSTPRKWRLSCSRASWTGSRRRSKTSVRLPPCMLPWLTLPGTCSCTMGRSVSAMPRERSWKTESRLTNMPATSASLRCANRTSRPRITSLWAIQKASIALGPLGRINVANACGTPLADAELQAFRQRFGRMPHSAFFVPLRAADRSAVRAGADERPCWRSPR